MTPKQFAELLEYIQKNNSWGKNMYEVVEKRNRKAVKYVDCSFDTRDGTVWQIVFRSITSNEREVVFRIESQKDIDAVYEWLDAPLINNK